MHVYVSANSVEVSHSSSRISTVRQQQVGFVWKSTAEVHTSAGGTY